MWPIATTKQIRWPIFKLWVSEIEFSSPLCEVTSAKIHITSLNVLHPYINLALAARSQRHVVAYTTIMSNNYYGSLPSYYSDLSPYKRWLVVLCVQLALTFVCFIANTVIFGKLYNIKRTKIVTIYPVVWIYFFYLTLYLVFKLVGVCCALVLWADNFDFFNPQSSLLIPAFIFDQMSLGYLILSFHPLTEFLSTKYTDAIHRENTDTEEFVYQKYRPRQTASIAPVLHAVAFSTYLIIVGIILAIVANSLIRQNHAAYRGMAKAVALVYLVGLVIIITASAKCAMRCYQMSNYADKRLVCFHFVFVWLSTTMLTVRMAYTIAAAFSREDLVQGILSKFVLVYGHWAYYTFMSFLWESLIIVAMCIFGIVVYRRKGYFEKEISC